MIKVNFQLLFNIMNLRANRKHESLRFLYHDNFNPFDIPKSLNIMCFMRQSNIHTISYRISHHIVLSQ